MLYSNQEGEKMLHAIRWETDRRCIEWTDWESDFIKSTRPRTYSTMTPKQKEVTHKLFDKLFSDRTASQ